MASNIIHKDNVQTTEVVKPAAERRVFLPATDIVEAEDHWLLRADMPGVDEKSLSITVEHDQLIIDGRVTSPEVDNHTLAYGEYETRDFHRSFSLSDEVSRNGIEALLKNGVLRLHIPKAASAKPHKIAVKAE
jgi:HSP20 family molecular chaperone IbpA